MCVLMFDLILNEFVRQLNIKTEHKNLNFLYVNNFSCNPKGVHMVLILYGIQQLLEIVHNFEFTFE